jgi:hypothetical protein
VIEVLFVRMYGYVTVDGQQIVLHASIVQRRTSVYMEDVGSNPTRSKHNSLFISNY